MTNVRLIAGLGNPGPEYEETRHNAGFWFVDRLARRAGVTLRDESKFHGEAVKVPLGGRDVWLLKPMTFMNRSGQAVQAISSFFKIAPEEILVVHDEVDLPVGVLRLKRGGGHGGNNGLRDITAHIGRDFMRLRVGVGRPERGGDMTRHVLRRPDAAERAELDAALDEAERVLDSLLADGLEKAMHALHTKQRQEDRKGRPGPDRGAAEQGTTPGARKKAVAEPTPAKPRHHAPPAERRRGAGDDERDEPASLKDQLLRLLRRDKH